LPHVISDRPRSEIISARTIVAASADVHVDASIGARCAVWDLAQVREGATVGAECVIGRGAYIGPGVRVGARVKIQNHALVYEPAILEDGVFVGPAAVLTNDTHPRAVNADGTPKGVSDWLRVGVTVRRGASLGARCVCVAPVTIGRWAMVAAGAVVTADVRDHALVVGVPARQIGWVGTAGWRLDLVDDRRWVCPRTGETYVELGGTLSRETAASVRA